MLVKIYWTIWAMVAAAAAMFFVAGYFTALTAVVFGFTAFGLVFMGMIGVLPAMVTHPTPPKQKAVAVPVTSPAKPAVSEGFGVLKSA